MWLIQAITSRTSTVEVPIDARSETRSETRSGVGVWRGRSLSPMKVHQTVAIQSPRRLTVNLENKRDLIRHQVRQTPTPTRLRQSPITQNPITQNPSVLVPTLVPTPLVLESESATDVYFTKLKQVIDSLKRFLEHIWEEITNFLGSVADDILETIDDILDTMWDIVEKILEKLEKLVNSSGDVDKIFDQVERSFSSKELYTYT